MKEYEFVQELFNTNTEILTKHKSLLEKSAKTLDHTNTEEIKRVYDLKTTIDGIEKMQEKLTERLQILAEEEK